jgi:hypothetical protein
MASDSSSQIIQKALAPYIKPREQTAYVRRVLALHLDSHLGANNAFTRPLALVDQPASPESHRNIPQGLQRDYIRALAANAAARAQYDEIHQEITPSVEPANDQQLQEQREEKRAAGVDLLCQHAAAIETRKKKERLEVLQKHMDALGQMPAASTTFLHQNEVFASCAPLPPVPAEVMESFTLDSNAPRGDLKALASRLERVALRAKLRFEKEESLLQEVKDRTSGVVEHARPDAKLRALNATRDELITWIETELSKTVDDGDDQGEGEGEAKEGSIRRIQEQDEIKTKVMEQLAEIKNLYTEYVASRKVLITATTSRPQVPTIVTKQPPPPLPFATDTLEPSTHLLLPLVKSLLSISREHKSTVTHKAYINASLAKQLRETCHALDTLASESQLLTNLGASRGPLGLNKATPAVSGRLGESMEKPSLTSQVKPWVTAADEAKLATLEAVAEKIEEGEVALKESIEAVEELNVFLGKDASQNEAADGGKQDQDIGDDGQDDDVWLTSEGHKSKIPSRKAASQNKKAPAKGQKGDIWSQLQENISLTTDATG